MKVEFNDNEVNIKLEKLKKAALINLKKVIAADQHVFISYMRTTFLRGGTTATKLRRRSGHLARSLQAQPVETKGTGVEGRITVGTVYSRVHIGPKGQVTKIPKHSGGKWLTIPIPWSPIMRKDGTVKATAAELKTGAAGLPFTKTIVKKSKKGNLIIWGVQQTTKGSNIGKESGGLVPLFLLRKQVKVKSRVHPEIFLPWIEKRIVADLKKEGFKIHD